MRSKVLITFQIRELGLSREYDLVFLISLLALHTQGTVISYLNTLSGGFLRMIFKSLFSNLRQQVATAFVALAVLLIVFIFVKVFRIFLQSFCKRLLCFRSNLICLSLLKFLLILNFLLSEIFYKLVSYQFSIHIVTLKLVVHDVVHIIRR